MMKTLGLTVAVLLSLGLGGCGGDDDGGDEGDGTSGSGSAGRGGAGRSGGGSGSGSTSTGSKADEIAMCMMMGTGSNSDCEGIDEYSACIQDACEDEYEACLGANYKKGDFSGGMCESLGDCVDSSDDACSCDPDAECTSCFTNMLGNCALNSGCALPDCTGGGGGTAGSGSIPMSDKTCADLKACCDSLDGQQKTACSAQYDGIKAAGDAACGIAYATLGTSLGCK